MTFINHIGDTTVLDYIFCSMIEAGDIDGVIPIDNDDGTIALLILGENYTGRVQISENGVEGITLASKSKDEELYESAHSAYEALPVHANIMLKESGNNMFTISIQEVKRD